MEPQRIGECGICLGDAIVKAPCCNAIYCGDCNDFASMIQTSTDSVRCISCKTVITDSSVWRGVLNDEGVQRLEVQIERLAGAGADQGEQD